MNFKKRCFVILVFATTLATGSASATCSKASLSGVWGVWAGATVAQFSADGKGNITNGSFTASQSGTIVTQTFTGTYSIATNCTGSLTLNITGGGTITASIVLDQMNKGLQIIFTTSGQTGAGLGVAEGTVTCGLTGKKATFATLLFGKISSTSTHVEYVFQAILDGHGHVSGSGTFDVGGTIHKGSITGSTYTENSNCTGTLHIVPPGLSALNFDFVVVNSGNELLAVETDTGTGVGGFIEQ